MRLTRNLARAAAGSAAVLAIGAGLASPASATPIISQPFPCDIGAGRVYCHLFVSNTVGPVTIRWVLDGKPVPEANDSPIFDFPCNTHAKLTTIKAIVTDSTGSSNANRTGHCGGVIP